MGDFFHQFSTPMGPAGGGGEERPTESGQDAGQHQPPSQELVVQGGPPKPTPFQSLGFFTGFPEPIMFNPQKTAKNRRKSAPGLDPIKHRRTRSGCYMCRSRRVKCDEARPICERCRKGKRECVYPDPTTAKSTTGQTTKTSGGPSMASPSSPDDEDNGGDDDGRAETKSDEDGSGPSEPPRTPVKVMARQKSSTSLLSRQRAPSSPRPASETPSAEGTKSSSPSASTGTAGSITPALVALAEWTGPPASTTRPEWAQLPRDVQFYLSYFCSNLTHYHYCMVTDHDDFFNATLPVLAVQNDALLFAVVGFAAYHYTLTRTGGQIKDFLQYYNRSVTLLLRSLQRKEHYTLSTLVTILQLATIEEYLGDWVNLMGHQKAALEILRQLYTPTTVLETASARMIMLWYIRFDVFVGLLGRFETALPRVWFASHVEYCAERRRADPSDLTWLIEHSAGQLRLISMEMSLILSKASRGELSPEEFVAEHERLHQELQEWRVTLDPAMINRAYLVTDFGAQQPDETANTDDIVNPYTSDMLFRPPLFATTVLMAEWHSIIIMHRSQAALPPKPELASGLAAHAYAICQLFEAVQLSPFSAKGSLMILHAPLAIAALFLPRDQKHHMWMRRKFALLESQGYIFPLTMRQRMAELFDDMSCMRWWLPNDDGFSPILQSVRAFADERNTWGVNTEGENLRQIRHLLGAIAKMKLSGQEQPGEESSAIAGKGKGKEVLR